jgi:hypothetical protein
MQTNVRSIEPNAASQPLEAGPQRAVISRVEDLGEQPRFEGVGTVWQYAIALEFPATDSYPTRTQWISANASIHPKSTLGKLIAAAGLKVNPVEPFDPTLLVGANVTALIEHVSKNDRTYANIVGFAALGRGFSKVSPQQPDVPLPPWLEEKRKRRLDNVPAPVAAQTADLKN